MKGGYYEHDNNEFRIINKENRFNNDIDNRVEPVKKTLNKIVKNIEKNFNMKDKNNVNMIGNIQRTVHNWVAMNDCEYKYLKKLSFLFKHLTWTY